MFKVFDDYASPTKIGLLCIYEREREREMCAYNMTSTTQLQ